MGSIGAIRVDHVQINIIDLPRAKTFYETVFGLAETPRPESFDFAGAWYKIGDMDLHLVVRDAEPASARHFCIWVAGVHTAAQYLQQGGHQIIWDTKYKIRGVDRFFVFDPDGNRIEIQGSDGTGASRWG